jgi:hypothetical protein
MKCARCGSELPAQAQYCLQCGSAVSAAVRPAAVVRPAAASAAASATRKRAIAGAVAAVAALAAGLAWMALHNRPGKVAEATGRVPNTGPLTERTGRIAAPGPLADRTGTVTPEPGPPVDVIDYLKFLKDIERQRVLLVKQQLADLLKQSGDLTYAGASADWSTNEPEQRYKEVYGRFQQALATWAAQWQQLSQRFLSKAAPQSCAHLRDAYYDLLGKTSTAIAQVGNSFSQAMGGDPSKAIETLSGMQGSGLGSASKDVGDACSAADDALGAVCDKFKIHKDFDIRDESGGSNLLGR